MEMQFALTLLGVGMLTLLIMMVAISGIVLLLTKIFK